MQFAGGMMAITTLMITCAAVPLSSVHPPWLYAMLVLSLRRSLLQYRAGVVLIHGPGRKRPPQTLSVQRYIKFAAFQSAVVLAILYFEFAVTGTSAVALAIALLLWPLILAAVLTLPRFRQFRKAIPRSEDQGFEGAAIYMTVFGIWGAISTALGILVTLLKIDIGRWPAYSWLFAVPALATLLIHSIVQIRGGFSELRGIGVGNPSSAGARNSPSIAPQGIDRPISVYAKFASHMFLFFGLGIIMITFQNLLGIVIGLGFFGFILFWPITVRRFITERQYAHFLAQYQPGGARTPDAGLTWLGWLLIGLAAFSTSFLLLELTLNWSATDRSGSGHAVSEWLATFHLDPLHSIWRLPLIAFELWAGFELVRMSSYAKIVASLFGIAAMATAIGLRWSANDTPHPNGGAFAILLWLAPLAFALVLPVATLLLVHRKIVFSTGAPPTAL